LSCKKSAAPLGKVASFGEIDPMATVLVIEDDPDMREIERAALGSAGFEVMVATNGREGLEALERQRPCVILLDLMMPIMDGLTFLSECRKRHLADSVPVVCVSAAGPEMVNHALSLGAIECLHKPADFDVLCERVAYHCSA
jgi:two-component system, chemotaxis family, chemotaxis protein CheY